MISRISAYCRLAFEIEANRFLHHMVRFLVGTMIEIALGRRSAETMDRLNGLVSDLSDDISAERSSRRKQYEYYRDKLLTFEEAAA